MMLTIIGEYRRKRTLFLIIISGLLFVYILENMKKADGFEVQASLSGTIIEMNGQTAIMSSDAGEIFVDLSVNSAVTFQVGDEIKAGYDGRIQESHPAKIKTLSVELVE